ncbi:hypothetical protein [Streptosporangium roseum]|uniref:hypothetical protein n=1 Tax=Streptosporangium roseum TaxID=2001 RepID=UPI00031641D5|nr:hypothetical protein [Streptosporangium roseum]
MNAHPAPERLAFADADARLDGALSACFQGDYDTARSSSESSSIGSAPGCPS